MKFTFRITLLLFISTLITQCKNSDSNSQIATTKSNLVKYAEGFSIIEYDNFSILSVFFSLDLLNFIIFYFKKHYDWLRGTDLNRRPSGYEPDELPDCSTPRYI